ncbi:MAG: hypothetical protein ABSG86_29045 [Thermoguttaceae bacterium]
MRDKGTPALARDLLPLLEDEWPTCDGSEKEICDVAATTIGGLSGRLDPARPDQAATIRLAREGMEKMLLGPHSVAAVDGLVALERDGKRRKDFLLAAADDWTLGVDTRWRALDRIAEFGDRTWVKRLVPLVSEKWGEGSLGEHAADTVARLLGMEQWITEDLPKAERAARVRKARAWAEQE